ncbi:Mif2/CENP-C like-domain-containing protein [Schizophyllum fasciatum]
MPTTPRRSSITSASLRLARPHVPFSNDPNVGRKTGRAFREVARDADGFEPFEHVVSQGDKFTPPRVEPQPVAHRRKRRKSSMPAIGEEGDFEDDAYGEQSMEIDSPLVSAAQPVSPAMPRRNASSRTLRYSDGYYDEIPSATTSGSARSRPSLSTAKANASRSRVSDATTRTSYATEYDDDSSDGGDNAFDMGAGYDPPGNSEDEMPPPPVPRRKSFSQMNQDDDEEEDEEEEEEEAPPPPPPKKKGKEKAAPEPEPESEPEQDQDMEPDIADGMDNVEMEGPRSDEEQEEQEQQQRSQKRKKNTDTSKSSSRARKENRPIVEGVRRSSRPHIKPLEYWRGEKYVYGRTESAAPVLTAPIKEIRRVAPEPVKPLGQKRRRGASSKPRSKSAVSKPATSASATAVTTVNTEEGWDDDTDSFGIINDLDLGEEVKRRITYTAKMVQTTPSANGEWAFDRIFSDANFMAAGVITLVPNGRKSTKPTKDNTYIFQVLEGAVNVRIHANSYILASGGMFMVPRGNTYFIENIADRETKLFFVQARKNVDPADTIVVQDGSGVSRVSGRSSQGVISGATDRSSAAGTSRRAAASK